MKSLPNLFKEQLTRLQENTINKRMYKNSPKDAKIKREENFTRPEYGLIKNKTKRGFATDSCQKISVL